MRTITDDFARLLLASLVIVGIVVLVVVVLTVAIQPEAVAIVTGLIGALVAILAAIGGYYFGSSSGSKEKTKALESRN